jgi:hypothetical protein
VRSSIGLGDWVSGKTEGRAGLKLPLLQIVPLCVDPEYEIAFS